MSNWDSIFYCSDFVEVWTRLWVGAFLAMVESLAAIDWGFFIWASLAAIGSSTIRSESSLSKCLGANPFAY